MMAQVAAALRVSQFDHIHVTPECMLLYNVLA
jgi:hypothetical protein